MLFSFGAKPEGQARLRAKKAGGSEFFYELTAFFARDSHYFNGWCLFSASLRSSRLLVW